MRILKEVYLAKINVIYKHEINDKDEEHVVNVCKTSEMQNVKGNPDLYLKCDVLFLAVLFENLRTEFTNYFKLDTTHYLFALGYSQDAMLRFTSVTLKLISGIQKYYFIESMIRGGISIICMGLSHTLLVNHLYIFYIFLIIIYMDTL